MPAPSHPIHELHSLSEIQTYLESSQSLSNVVIQSVNLSGLEAALRTVEVSGALFLGCQLPDALLCDVVHRGALVFPKLPATPFNPYQPELYSAATLFNDFRPLDPCSYCQTLDARVYAHWRNTGRSTPHTITEALARRLHDHAMTDAMHDFLADTGRADRVIAVMGGHDMQRSDPSYRQVAQIARTLTQQDHLVVSGGGPGAMEATHLGAWFADRTESDLMMAIDEHLAAAPSYKDYRWLAAAYEVMQRFPPLGERHVSLGIPTWLYGHEPPNPFATHIAKYFANSVREDGLVTIASAGILFSPGNAGTIQEIFQDAAQNHYMSTGTACPMVFLNKDYWANKKPIYPLLEQLSAEKDYGRLLGIFDESDDVVQFFQDHPPIQGDKDQWVYCDEFCKD